MNIRKILVVDDNEGDQFLTKIEIEKHNPDIEIVQAYDGVEALEKLDNTDENPDLILLDINMPRMNGLEFLEKYNEREKQCKTIVMLTSSQEQDKEAAFKYEFVKDYLVKLLDQDNIKRINDL